MSDEHHKLTENCSAHIKKLSKKSNIVSESYKSLYLSSYAEWNTIPENQNDPRLKLVIRWYSVKLKDAMSIWKHFWNVIEKWMLLNAFFW